MDVSPSDKMFRSMQKFVDSAIGEAPSPLLVGGYHARVRERRDAAFNYLHHLVAIAMREGVNRAILEACKRQAGILDVPQDMEDRNARAQAKDDAVAGGKIVSIRGASGG